MPKKLPTPQDVAPKVQQTFSFKLPEAAGKTREGSLADNLTDLQTAIAAMRGLMGNISRPDFGRLVIFYGMQYYADEMGYVLVNDKEKGEYVLMSGNDYTALQQYPTDDNDPEPTDTDSF